MASIGTTEIGSLFGELPHEYLPIAATQSGTSRIRPGWLVTLSGGQITNLLAASGSWTSATLGYGVADFESVKTVNGVATALAAGVFVSVIPFASGIFLDLPVASTQAPVYTSDMGAGANTTGFQVLADANNKLQIDLSQTGSPVVRPFGMSLRDWVGGTGISVKGATGVTGDRYRCAILVAAKQVVI